MNNLVLEWDSKLFNLVRLKLVTSTLLFIKLYYFDKRPFDKYGAELGDFKVTKEAFYIFQGIMASN